MLCITKAGQVVERGWNSGIR